MAVSRKSKVVPEPTVASRARKQANANTQAAREAANKVLRATGEQTPWQAARTLRNAARADKQMAHKIAQNKGMGRA